MTIFISGGARNGKSDFAQALAVFLAERGVHYYVATMIPTDDEDQARIQKHLDSREGMGFETIECGRNILSCLDRVDRNGTFLLDSATALLMNELFPAEQGYRMDPEAPERCASELETFVRSIRHGVIVSDAIYADAARYDPITEAYRRGLAHIDRVLARACDTVIEVAADCRVIHKGSLPAGWKE